MQLQNVSWSEKAKVCHESWNEVGAGFAEIIPMLCRSTPGFLGLLSSEVHEPAEFRIVIVFCRIVMLLGADWLVEKPIAGTLSCAGYWTCKLAEALEAKWPHDALRKFLQTKGLECDEGMVHLKLRNLD